MELSVRKQRQSNFELLRIICILFIVIHHIGYHSIRPQTLYGSLWTNSPFTGFEFHVRLLLLETTNIFGPIANNIFILITGFFLMQKDKIDIKGQIIKLLSQMIFLVVLFVPLSIFISNLFTPNISGLFSINQIGGGWWFAGYYLAIIVIAHLFLNQRLQQASKDQYLTFILVLLCAVALSWPGDLLSDISVQLRQLFTGILMYAIGGYLQKYNPFSVVKTRSIIGFLFVVFALFWISYYNNSISMIRDNIAEQKEFMVQHVNTYYIYNFICMILAIAVFELFRRTPLKYNATINQISTACFMVYLLHDNTFFRNIFSAIDWMDLYHSHLIQFMITWFILSVGVYLLGFVTYYIYNMLISLLKRKVVINN